MDQSAMTAKSAMTGPPGGMPGPPGGMPSPPGGMPGMPSGMRPSATAPGAGLPDQLGSKASMGGPPSMALPGTTPTGKAAMGFGKGGIPNPYFMPSPSAGAGSSTGAPPAPDGAGFGPPSGPPPPKALGSSAEAKYGGVVSSK